MRILVLNWQDRLNPQAGGAEIHLHEVFGRLATRGHDVRFLVSGFTGAPEREVVDGVAVHRAGGRLTFGLQAPKRYRSGSVGGGFDVVVEDLNKVPLFSPWWVESPVVLLVHHLFGATAFHEAPLPMAAATWLLERPLPWVYRNTPVVAVSESTAADLRARGLRRREIRIVPNGVDLEGYSPDPDVPRFPEPTLLYLGRLKRYKGIELILEALARLRKDGTGARLLIAGKGSHEEALRRLATELGLGDSARFLGYVDEATKRELLRRAWINVLTSPKEGWGIVNMEAAACATPTVASDSPGLRDSVRHGETGLLVPHGDTEALAGSLGGLLRNQAERERMGRAARRFAEGFSWDASALAMESFLAEWVAAPPPHR